MNVYLTVDPGYDRTMVYRTMAIVSLILASMMPFRGGHSDRLGRKRGLSIGFAGYVALVVPAMAPMAQGNIRIAAAALLVSTLPMLIVQTVGDPIHAEPFPTGVRYTGMATSFDVAAVSGGGFTPYLSTWLIPAIEIRPMPGFLLAGGALTALATLLTSRETSREALD